MAGSDPIMPLKMPKWGLSMTEGTVTHWWKSPGDTFAEGEDLLDVETSKINNAVEAPASGRLRRIVVEAGETAPVGGLLAVAADDSVADSDIEAFIAEFQSNFVPEADAEGAGGFERRTLEAGGRRLSVGVAGDPASAPPVVLIHGFAGDLNNWILNLDAIAAAAPIVAFDLPGHGQSAKALTSGDLGELAQAVSEGLDALGVARFHLVGHSLGGAVAMRIALDRTADVVSLVLIAPAGLPGSRLDAAFVDGVVEAQTGRQLAPVLRKLFSDPALASADLVDNMMKFKRLDGADEALAAIRDRMFAPGAFAALQSRLGDLPDATLILGTADAVVSPPDRAALPRAWTIVEVDSGHMPQLEKAADVNALILATIGKEPQP